MIIRKAKKNDLEAIKSLYKKAAKILDGIARTPKEITKDYVTSFLSSSLKNGLIFVAENPNNSNQLIAEIHCYKIGPKCFDHTLSNLTIVVDPKFHGQGFGYKIFSKLLEEVKNKHPNIIRIDLDVRAINKRAQALYKKLGFEIDGYLRKRIANHKDEIEDDIIMSWLNPNFKC